MRGLVSVAAIAVGVLRVVILTVGLANGDATFIDKGATLIVAGLAGLGAVAGLETWRTERRRARETRQREVYSQLLSQLYARFQGRFDMAVEARVRTEVVTWGSPEVVRALGAWMTVLDELIRDDRRKAMIS
jgi:hypothetical protein